MRKNIRRLFALLLSLGMIIGAGQALASQKIINGIDANFPPFAFVDKTGKPSGFDVEAMNWIAKEIGVEVIHQPVEWDGIVTSLMTKKIDIIASGMSITEDRAKKVAFSMPYWEIKQVMVTRKDSTLTVEDILNGGKKLGAQQGTSEAKWLKENKKKNGWNFTLKYYPSSPLSVEDILNGRIDAAAMDDAPAKDAISKKPIKSIGTFGMHEEYFGYATRKEDKELRVKVDTALAKLMNDPYWEELKKKYEM